MRERHVTIEFINITLRLTPCSRRHCQGGLHPVDTGLQARRVLVLLVAQGREGHGGAKDVGGEISADAGVRLGGGENGTRRRDSLLENVEHNRRVGAACHRGNHIGVRILGLTRQQHPVGEGCRRRARANHNVKVAGANAERGRLRIGRVLIDFDHGALGPNRGVLL